MKQINHTTTPIKSIMKMKLPHSLALLAVTSVLFINSTSVRASETDARIESAAINSYVFKTYLKDDSIKTESSSGVVLLTGTVNESFHKSLAQDTVEGLPGVKSVDNQLKVQGEIPEEHSDRWLSLKVRTALMFHRNVSASRTEVSTKNGTVSLKGEASSLAQKELTTEYAQDVEGVKAVDNEMTIEKTPSKPVETIEEKIDDASITAEIKASLVIHRSTSSLKTMIQTKEGVVTVSGIAKNAAEKSLVTKLVTDIYGVIKVINNMTIETATASNS
jgi:osmotically-inducible protein OsmY